MISLVLAESALELVPLELQDHPSVLSHAQKLGKNPSEILLDNSWHFAAMKGINNEIKRGRPDLVHFSILEATTISLYLQNKIKIYIHTIEDKSFSELINEIKPSKIIGFSTKGELSSFEKISSEISDNTCLIIGGFQKGHFSESTKSKITHLFSVDTLSYEAHVVIARILYEYEKTVFM